MRGVGYWTSKRHTIHPCSTPPLRCHSHGYLIIVSLQPWHVQFAWRTSVWILPPNTIRSSTNHRSATGKIINNKHLSLLTGLVQFHLLYMSITVFIFQHNANCKSNRSLTIFWGLMIRLLVSRSLKQDSFYSGNELLKSWITHLPQPTTRKKKDLSLF